MKPPNKPITDDMPRLRRITEGIREHEVNPGDAAATDAMIGNLALSATILRSSSCGREHRAAVLRRAIRYGAALLALYEGTTGADVRIAVDVCRVAEDPNLERHFDRNVVSRKEWAGRLQEVLDEALLAKERDNRDAMLAHLARWVTLCTLWVALILDEKEPE